MKKILATFLLTIMLMIVACGPAKVTAKAENEAAVVEEEAFDSPIIIEELPSEQKQVDGFRVRAAKTTSQEEADQIEKKIVDSLKEPVYQEYIVDKYMIYVGDCKTKKEADYLKERLVKLGFTERLFIVRTKVYDHSKTPIQTESLEQEESFKDLHKISGYRIQIFAANNKENAEKVLKEAQTSNLLGDEKIYILLREGKYKVQIGDFKSRLDAQEFRSKIRDKYPSSFVTDKILVFTTEKPVVVTGEFFIQLGAFTNNESANKLKSLLANMNYRNVSVLEEDGVKKVVMGSYRSRDEAELVKAELVNRKFTDAWIYEK